jgi:hypothetical protein
VELVCELVNLQGSVVVSRCYEMLEAVVGNSSERRMSAFERDCGH